MSRASIIHRGDGYYVKFGLGLDGPYSDPTQAEAKASWITQELEDYDSGRHNLLRLSQPSYPLNKGKVLEHAQEDVRSPYSGLSVDVGLSKTRAMMTRKAKAVDRKRRKKLPYVSGLCAEPDCRASTLNGLRGKPAKFCKEHRDR